MSQALDLLWAGTTRPCDALHAQAKLLDGILHKILLHQTKGDLVVGCQIFSVETIGAGDEEVAASTKMLLSSFDMSGAA